MATVFTAYMFVVFVTNDRVWLPVERLTGADGTSTVGYMEVDRLDKDAPGAG